MSTTQKQPPTEEWQDLIAWDEELYDPLFQGAISFARMNNSYASFHDYHAPESVTSNQGYEPSPSVSVSDGPCSLDYTESAPPSVVDGPSSFNRPYFWLSASPSFATKAASPLSEESLHVSTESPFTVPAASPLPNEVPLPGSLRSPNSLSTTSLLFNPFVANSSHAFNSLDVTASQAFANVGGRVDQPQIIEPIPELDGAVQIPLPRSPTHDTFSSLPETEGVPLEQGLIRAVTIPRPNTKAASYHGGHRHRNPHQILSPMLSVSPEARYRTRSATLSRSTSRTESRRSRNSLTSPSPTLNNIGWVSYQINAENRLVPSGTDGNTGRRQRGRTRGLTPAQRKNAALMRVLGACSNCKKRKEKCDPGIPCKSCLDHYRGELVNFPCRDRHLSDLSGAFLADPLGWHPTARALESFIEPNDFSIVTGLAYNIPLNLGFGPLFRLAVHRVHTSDCDPIYHNHVIHSWPPDTSPAVVHTHVVLPAVLSLDARPSLRETLDLHLSLLVTHHFHSFPLYCSPLRILREVYLFYRSLPANSPHSRLLLTALKLLVLVHIGGDLTLPPPSSDPILQQLVRKSIPISAQTEFTPTPCFIRAQFGAVLPDLAMAYMKDILSQLEQLLLNRECADWPLALAVLITLLMTIESIHYHSAKLPYHHCYDPDPVSSNKASEEEERKVDDLDIEKLLGFYEACFSGCHARLRPDWEGEGKDKSEGMDNEDVFVKGVREAIRKACDGDYLAKKANETREENDMAYFFDRLVAKLLLLKV